MARKTLPKQKTASAPELTQRVKELEENWKRALADYHNLEKRIGQQQQTFVRIASAALIDKLLGVVDDLERAASHLKDEGLNLVLTQLKAILESEGVRGIATDGEQFNPETMDCSEMVEGQKNTVVKTLQKGYTLNDHVIRPAKVQVGTGKHT